MPPQQINHTTAAPLQNPFSVPPPHYTPIPFPTSPKYQKYNPTALNTQQNDILASNNENDSDNFEYLQNNFSDVDELELLTAIFQVQDNNGGSLIGLSRSKMVNEVRKCLKKAKLYFKINQDFVFIFIIFRGVKLGWDNVDNEPKLWQNDHSEKKCCICFDGYDIDSSYTLKCQHEFHRKVFYFLFK